MGHLASSARNGVAKWRAHNGAALQQA
jgi:hypothetical protein